MGRRQSLRPAQSAGPHPLICKGGLGCAGTERGLVPESVVPSLLLQGMGDELRPPATRPPSLQRLWEDVKVRREKCSLVEKLFDKLQR